MGSSAVLKYPGSKWSIADWIISYMPSHEVYLEPYFGSGAVFFSKRPAKFETINDLDGDVINLFRVIREMPEALAEAVQWTPWARKEYENILPDLGVMEAYVRTWEPVEDARRFLVRMHMAFGSKTSDRTGWRNNITGKGRGTSQPKVWGGIPGKILAAAGRLKNAQIECQPALQLIERYRKPEVLIYVDPPYLRETRSKRMYAKEMMDRPAHEELLDTLGKHPGPVLISHYAHELYDNRLKHWTRWTIKAIAELGQEREEVLWLNPVAAEAGISIPLFEVE
ncbi:MAG: DNA methyltransferase [Peptococcaceae bacterium BICA1-7]|nr:MAG: DNA methyltransferase [Peptococcaceae bacterium BICA1-7]HBV97992.1 DNA adenine methylase [Desulfotomaculum sp.]